VYEWIRLDSNEPFYVGKGKERRYLKCDRPNNKHFNNIMKSTSAVVNILHNNLTEQEANEIECWYIHEYKFIWGFDIVNITDGGEGVAGYKATEIANKMNRMRRHGFDIDEFSNDIIDMYVNLQLSTSIIGAKYNVTRRCIRSVLQRNNITLRTSGETLAINQIGDKRYNSKYVIIQNYNQEYVKVCNSYTDFAKWAVAKKLTSTEGCARKVLTTYKNTNKLYKGLYIYQYSKDEFYKLNIDKSVNQEIQILDVNTKFAHNAIIVEVYNKQYQLLHTFFANKDCINWLCTTDLCNVYNTAKNAIDRCCNNMTAYKDTYYFEKYTNSRYTQKLLNEQNNYNHQL
jgi:hypothetical protein